MNLLKNDKGMAMPLVLIVFIVIALLGTALWQYGISELNFSVRDEKRARAYYVARSGAESIARSIMVDMDLLEEILGELDESADNEITFNKEEFGEDYFDDEKIIGFVEVKIKRLSETSLEITGIGTVDGIIQSVGIQMERWEPFDGVIYAMNSLDFDKGVKLIGDIVIGGNSVKFGGTEVNNWNEELGAYKHENVEGIIKKDNPITWPKALFPVAPSSYSGTLQIKENTPLEDRTLEGPVHYYKTIQIDNKANLIVDASTQSVLIDVEIFDMKNGSKLTLITSSNHDLIIAIDKKITIEEIVIEGNGVVEIFVRDGGEAEFKTKGADVLDENDPYLIINLGTGANMQIQADSPQSDSVFQGLIYGPEATVRLGGNASFKGSIIVENLWGSGGGKNYIVGSPHTLMNKSRYSWAHLEDYGNYLMVRWLR